MFIVNFYNGSLELDVQIYSACNPSKLLLFFHVVLKVWKFNSAIDLVYLGLPWGRISSFEQTLLSFL